ncbi:MAG: MBL fold metallo-hydrolase, partial [Pseudomonas sp.]
SHSVQLQHPEVSIEFDSDQQQAIKTRTEILSKAAAKRWLVAGAHMPFPGLGHVRSEENGYSWVPVEYSPVRTDR